MKKITESDFAMWVAVVICGGIIGHAAALTFLQ